MSARVLVIGLDAAEATLLERWAEEGDLPAFARLARDGGTARLGNSLETLPGAIWPELTTGISGGRTGLYYHPRQIHSGDTVLRLSSRKTSIRPSTTGFARATRGSGSRWSTNHRPFCTRSTA